jgi:hypothetical protein
MQCLQPGKRSRLGGQGGGARGRGGGKDVKAAIMERTVMNVSIMYVHLMPDDASGGTL